MSETLFIRGGRRRGSVYRRLALLVPLAFGRSPLLAQEVSFTGDFIQGGLVQGTTQPEARVKVDGTPVRVSDQGIFLLGLDRDAAEQVRVEVTLPGGETRSETLRVARREYQIQRIDGLPPKKVTPPEEDLKRIREEAALVGRARKLDAPRTDFLTGFVWPAKGRISGVYGSQRILNGEPRRPHFGVDVAAPVGTTVVAPADGVVTLAREDMYFSGGTLTVDHGHGLSSSFLHLSRILVEERQQVRQGQPIAEIGATGRVTGAHLDWRMNLFRHRLDPQLLVAPMPAG